MMGVWERQVGEPVEAFEAFEGWLRGVPRGVPVGEWVSVWGWLERARAWDVERVLGDVDRRVSGLVEMGGRQVTVASLALSRAVGALRDGDLGAVATVRQAAVLEQVARGMDGLVPLVGAEGWLGFVAGEVSGVR